MFSPRFRAGVETDDQRRPVRLWSALAAVALAALIAIQPVAASARPSEKALETKDRRVRAQCHEALELYDDEQYAAAETIFRTLGAKDNLSDDDQAIFHFMAARCLFDQDKLEAALQEFLDFQERYPESEHIGAAWVFIGHARYKSGEPAPAGLAYAQALTVGPEDHRQIALANLEPLIERGLRTPDLEHLAAVLGNDEWSAKARLLIGDRLASANRRGAALAQYRLVIGDFGRSGPGKTAQKRIDELRRDTDGPMLVGVLCPLGGDYADFGRDMATAARLAADQHAGDVELVVLDTKGDALKAAWAADSLVDAGCEVVVGPLLTDCIAASAGYFRSYGIVQILPVARRGHTVTGLSPWIFALSVPSERQFHRLLGMAADEDDIRHIAALIADDSEPTRVKDALLSAAAEADIFISAVESFESGETDYTPTIRRLQTVLGIPSVDTGTGSETISKISRKRTPPSPIDAILIWGAEPDDLLHLVPQLRAAGFRSRFLGDGAWGDSELLEPIRPLLDSVLFVSDERVNTDRPGWSEFAAAFRKKSGGRADWLAGRTYDIVNWLAETHTSKKSRPLSERLMSRDGIAGISGTYRFAADRHPRDVPVYRYEKGRPLLVSNGSSGR